MAKEKFKRRPCVNIVGTPSAPLQGRESMTGGINALMALRFRTPSEYLFFPPIEDNREDQATTARLHESTSQSVPIVSTVDHARTLDALKHNEPIPETFRCSINFQIMTDPVFDPNYPQYKFERVAIEHSLRIRAENPYTRTSLMISELVSDAILRQEIDQYVAEIVHENSPNPMC